MPEGPRRRFANEAKENRENRLWREYLDAMDEEQKLIREVDSILAAASDLGSDEQRVANEYGERLSTAMRRAHDALDSWLKETLRNSAEDQPS